MPCADTDLKRLQAVRERIAVAARRAGNSPEGITLVAVSKGVSYERLAAIAREGGQLDFGENYVQEAIPKINALADLTLRWHFIGHLQRNKVRQLLGCCTLVQSLDSVRLAEEFEHRGGAEGVVTRVLLQVNLAREAGKHGLDETELRPCLEALAGMPHLEPMGLMLIPPLAASPAENRPLYRSLQKVSATLRELGYPLGHHLSMGMSDDFDLAVEEGATIVRVGTAVFGPRRYPLVGPGKEEP